MCSFGLIRPWSSRGLWTTAGRMATTRRSTMSGSKAKRLRKLAYKIKLEIGCDQEKIYRFLKRGALPIEVLQELQRKAGREGGTDVSGGKEDHISQEEQRDTIPA